MKTMTCQQLGGPCNIEHQGKDHNEVIKAQDRHLKAQVAGGDEALGSTWSFLDITPYGRQEEWEDSPEGWPQTPPYTWASWHDKYGRTL